MMKQVLIDTNVALDFYMRRPEFFDAADRIFQAIRDRKIAACISASVVTDLYYMLRRRTNEKHARKVVEIVYATFRILTVSRRLIREALDAPMDDFEDAIQAVAAKNCGIDIVVTSDKLGFHNSDL
jgi:predicted nucleic acid-binding protein